MNHHALPIVVILLLIGAFGCQPDERSVESVSPVVPPADSTTQEDASDAPRPTPTVDPDIDAGMMIDELERSQRFNAEPVETSEVLDEPGHRDGSND